jgi:hypothetical protein
MKETNHLEPGFMETAACPPLTRLELWSLLAFKVTLEKCAFTSTQGDDLLSTYHVQWSVVGMVSGGFVEQEVWAIPDWKTSERIVDIETGTLLPLGCISDCFKACSDLLRAEYRAGGNGAKLKW